MGTAMPNGDSKKNLSSALASRQPRQQQQQPLVPLKFADAPTQRLYALSILAIIQACKIAQLLTYYATSTAQKYSGQEGSQNLVENGTDLFMKWTVLDALSIFILSCFRIPWLSFSPRVVFLQSIVAGLGNYVAFGPWEVASIAGLLPGLNAIPGLLHSRLDYVTTTSEHRVRLSRLNQLGPNHPKAGVLGKYTIRILPSATAKLNPLKTSFCLANGGSNAEPVEIPLVVNNTEPAFISFKVVDLETDQFRLWNVTADALSFEAAGRKWKGKRRKKRNGSNGREKQISPSASDDEPEIFEDITLETDVNAKTKPQHRLLTDQLGPTQALFMLPISVPGRYSLERLLDSNGMDARLYTTQTVLVPCPKVAILDSDGQLLKRSNEVMRDCCVGESYNAKIVVNGVPPFKVQYVKSSAGRERTKDLNSVGTPLQDSLPYATESVDIPLDLSLTSAGEHSIAIDRVEDALGNVVDYKSRREEHISNLGSAAGSLRIFAHSRAAVRWLTCNDNEPIGLLEGQQSQLRIRADETSRGDGPPWEIEIGFKSNGTIQPLLAGGTADDWDRVLTHSLQGTSGILPVNKAGSYVLLSGQGKFCPVQIMEPASCPVVDIPPPELVVNFTDVQDQCAGSIGMRAVLSFTSGTPPFVAHYDVYRNSKLADRKTVRFGERQAQGFAQMRYEISDTPPDEAEYRYVFHRIDDAQYTGRPVQFEWSQVVKPLATASFADSGSRRLRSCSSESFEAGIELQGQGPWVLEYETVAKGKSKIHKLSEITEAQQSLRVMVPDAIRASGGPFTVGLVAVTDSHGCRRVLNAPVLKVDVKKEQPTAAFAPSEGVSTISILEGRTATLPLRLTGDGPWSLECEVNGHRTHVKLYSPNSELTVKEAGTYKLVSVRDQYCPGLVGKSNEFEVNWYPRPSLSIRNLEDGSTSKAKNGSTFKKATCRGAYSHAELALEGSPPFEIGYQVQRAGELKRRTETLQAALRSARVPLYTEEAGHYRYAFETIGDDLYSSSGPSETPMLEQTVFELPSANFKDASKRLSFCKGESMDDAMVDSATITLRGQPPFTVEIAVIEQETGKVLESTIDGIDGHEHVLRPSLRIENAGPYIMAVTKVVDGNGCKREIALPDLRNVPDSSAIIRISVIETAQVNAVDPSADACVGDALDYVLDGTPPWIVDYTFNGHEHKTKSRSSTFSRVAEEPGVFEIQRISHLNTRCKSILASAGGTPGLKKIVHALPGATTHGGKEIVENIREGDKTKVQLSFSGEPPFTFKWRRADHSGHVEEHTVSNWQGHEYTIWTSQEGVFDVSYVRDRYCEIPKKRSSGSAVKG